MLTQPEVRTAEGCQAISHAMMWDPNVLTWPVQENCTLQPKADDKMVSGMAYAD